MADAPAPVPALTLYPYQRAWFDDRSRFKIGMFARQTGKTFTTCLELVDDVFAAEAEGRRTRWVILSRGERQAKEAMDEAIKPFCRAYQALFRAVLEIEPVFREYEWQGQEVRCNALEVSFPGGSRVTALPANPDTARGFSANVFLDEFAFHADSRRIWAALFPVISNGYKLRVVSTPNGKGNKFFDLVTGSDDRWSRHVVDIHRAVAEGLPRDVDALREALADDDAWAQEYELQWLDEASAWLSYDLIGAVEHPAAGDPAGYQGGPCCVGNDIAARNDLWVAWVLEAVGDVLWTREIVTLKRASFADQDAVLDDLFQRYRVVRVCMDQTGMGEKPVEDARRRYGSDRVEGILFTSANKLMLATVGKEAFEDRRIRVPAGDPVLRADLHKLKKVTGPTGTPRFVAESDSTGHADRAWAGFLAVHAAGSPHQPYAYIPVRPEQTTRQVRLTSGLRARRGSY
ncbi:terminase large subunit domain-containing protein [Roseospira goensis]|uniref:Phage FluMu gp28-like protein n=1 Tax=Roseospira goensis TaxID=391922 RepID=A0A7W6S2V0_9PROT|nr:terminase family protein [Roseospira goensis]MBB4287737.1 phage FluMu gp28-like protein [Roseospira goensis]